MRDPCIIALTGASGALGAALARCYAKKGVRLILQGRQAERLEAVAEQCRSKGANVEIAQFDLTDAQAVQDWLDRITLHDQVDLFIANAGVNIAADTGVAGVEQAEEAIQLISVNVTTVVLACNHMAEAMARAGRGQIVLISSLAAWRGLPLCPSYSGSKAFVRVFGQALRSRVRKLGVSVTVAMPGYFVSDMSKEMAGPKPFVWSPERAARAIVRRSRKAPACITFPFLLYCGVRCLAWLPDGLAARILAWLGYDAR